jgi:hypothetical protein
MICLFTEIYWNAAHQRNVSLTVNIFTYEQHPNFFIENFKYSSEPTVEQELFSLPACSPVSQWCHGQESA